MTLKELLLKYEFDTVVPDLLTVDEPIKDNLYAFKEAFDTLRRMVPGDAQGEQIVVSLEVETEEDGAEIEYLFSGDGRGRYCLLMVNSTPAAARVRVVIPGRQFAAPTYRALSCPEKFVDCREVPGEGSYWHRLSWEDTQTGYETWSNWEPQGNTYVPLPCDVKPKCDDMFVTVEPYTVQSVEFMTRAAKSH